MNCEVMFHTIFPGFFEQEGIRYLPESAVFAELVMDLREPLPCSSPLSCPDTISFRVYEGPIGPLQEEVRSVEEDWVQYFHEGGRYFCAFSGERIAAFCALTEFGTVDGLRIGGPGCVGTVPEFRKQGIGLEMVRRATEILQQEGFGLSWIHWTHLERWYQKLGYRPVLRWNRRGFLAEESRVFVRQVNESKEKQAIARMILEGLKDWFGNPEAREAYIRDSGSLPFFAAEREGHPVGFLCLKETGNATVKLAVMGVQAACHRQGVGKALFDAAKEYAVSAGYLFMQVKTVQMGHYEDYDRTNRFYRDMGFQELEVIPAIWGEENPCQIYVQALQKENSLIRLIRNRRSYRGRYIPDRVPRDKLTAILEAGLAAPSGCNKQTVSLIAVDDPEVLSRIHAVIDPPVGETAPAMICVLSQRINAYRDRCFATQDYSAVIENMLLAITALGYQSCWYEGHITDTDRICDKIAEILSVPEGYDLVAILPVGIAEGEPVAPKKKPFEERAWFNGFQVRPEIRENGP